ncbi:Rieske (2Fe-2S) protein [Candidatus Uhrbacteria bacterium]|nr:Rieske (2Fe-2S) protein [Candidatus Uhrbacteria bacterium]
MEKHLLGKFSEIPPGRSRSFVADNKKIFVINVDGVPKGYVNRCPHMGGTLHGAGPIIRCQWHGLMFEAATGVGKAGDGQKLEMVNVVLEGDDLFYVPAEKPKSPWADDF